MPTYEQTDRPLRIKTPLGENVLLLQSLSGSERLGRPFQYELVLLGEAHNVEHKDILGQNVTIFVEKPGKEPRFFHGYISRFAQTKYERKMAEYHATMVPWLWFLTRSSDCRIFQNKTIPEILKQVFDDHGFSDVIDRLHGSYRQWDYCVQYRETAFDFVSRLMEEEGIYYYFKHEEEKHSLVLCDSPASHKQFAGYEQLLYRPSAASVQETLWSWVVQHEVQSGGYQTTDFDFKSPRRNSLANSFVERGHGHGQFEQFDYLGEQSPFNEGERYSRLRLEERQAQHEVFSGEGDARGVSPGVRFTLKGHPRKDFEREYLTTGADYLVSQALENTSGQGPQFEYKTALTAIPLDEQFRAPRLTPKPIVHGPQTALVVGPSGQKIYTDEYGRVKVHFHWDRHGNPDENASCWIRVSQGWAGKPAGRNWGDMAVPHVGDEVIVECLEGDPDRPIITGRVYNHANMPPMTLPANKERRVWIDDFGNEMVFDATPGDEHIILRSPHHNSGITLGRSATTYTESNTNTCNLGSSFTTTLGFGLAITAGGSSSATLGSSISGVLGLNASVNIGPQFGITFGPQFSYNRGLKYDNSIDDDYKICDKNYVLSVGEKLNLVGGANKESGGGTRNSSSIVFADDTKLELTVGDHSAPVAYEHKAAVKNLNIVSGVLFLATAALMGSSAALVDSYNPAPTNSNESTEQQADDAYRAVVAYDAMTQDQKNAYDAGQTAQAQAAQDANTQRQNDSLKKQIGFEVAAGATFLTGLICMFISQRLASTQAVDTILATHEPDKTKARLLLDGGASASAILQADKKVSILSAKDGTFKAQLSMEKAQVTLENSAGNIKIQAGTSGITITKDGEIKISGTKVSVTGLNVASGALTVLDQPVAMVSDLAAKVAALEAADLAEATKRKALNVELTAMKAAKAAASQLSRTQSLG